MEYFILKRIIASSLFGLVPFCVAAAPKVTDAWRPLDGDWGGVRVEYRLESRQDNTSIAWKREQHTKVIWDDNWGIPFFSKLEQWHFYCRESTAGLMKQVYLNEDGSVYRERTLGDDQVALLHNSPLKGLFQIACRELPKATPPVKPVEVKAEVPVVAAPLPKKDSEDDEEKNKNKKKEPDTLLEQAKKYLLAKWQGVQVFLGKAWHDVQAWWHNELYEQGMQGKPWRYDGETGPKNWHLLDKKNLLCGYGEEQSPIDIQKLGPPLRDLPKFHYEKSVVSLVDNGRSLHALVMPGAFLDLMGTAWRLSKIVFHSPGEEVISGERSPMSVQFVHRNIDGQLLVVSVPVVEGKAHATISEILESWPKVSAQKPSLTAVDLASLMPLQTRFYHYMGSLTEPPCSEQVAWYLAQTPIVFSKAQIAEFLTHYPSNVRPVRSQGARMVYVVEE